MALALRRLVVCVVCTLLIAGCGERDEAADQTSAGASPPTDGDRPLVVATHSILGDVARNIVGDDAVVEVLMPPGTDPHDFAPSPKQATALREADAVIANGHGFEEGLLDALGAAEDEGVDVFEVGEQVQAIPLADQAGADPHFFTDPVRMADAVDPLTAHLASRAEALDTEAVRSRGQAYAGRLRQTSDEMAQTLSVVPPERRKLVTNHEVFAYFAERFGFEVVGTIVPGGTTLAEPSSQDLDELTRTIKAAQVPAIFAETSAPDRLAGALAAEAVDVEVVELFTESLGPPGSEGATYVDMMTVDARRIADALRA